MSSGDLLISLKMSFSVIIHYTQIGSSLIETRFGAFSSTLFNMISISSNTGAINASLAESQN